MYYKVSIVDDEISACEALGKLLSDYGTERGVLFSVNRYIGMIWLSELLYPDAFNYDLLAETQRYYQLFYHYDLSEEQFNQLCANSLA